MQTCYKEYSKCVVCKYYRKHKVLLTSTSFIFRVTVDHCVNANTLLGELIFANFAIFAKLNRPKAKNCTSNI